MGYREEWFENNKSRNGWYTCVRCKKSFRKSEIDIDHIIPKKHGGKDHLNNLQCMCKHCNRSKQDDIGMHTIKDYSKNSINNATKSLFKSLSKIVSKK